jgi:uncharacterized protein DUF5615
MTEVFGRLYFDEDVSARVAQLVRARGFDIVTTVEAKRLGSTDRSQLEFAAAETASARNPQPPALRAIERLLRSSGDTHAGIIIAVRRPPRDLAGRLLGILNRLASDEMLNQLLYV